MRAAQCLPPGGRGTAKRWMRNGDILPFAMQSIQTVQPFPMYLFNEMHTDSEHIAVPHPPPCGGTFPPGQCHQLKEPGPVFPVIASQCAHWRGNPFPLQRHDFLHVTKEKTDCHVASLLAMTVVDGTLALKLMTLPPGGRYCVPSSLQIPISRIAHKHILKNTATVPTKPISSLGRELITTKFYTSGRESHAAIRRGNEQTP